MPKEIQKMCTDDHIGNYANYYDPRGLVLSKNNRIDGIFPPYTKDIFPFGGTMESIPERGEPP